MCICFVFRYCKTPDIDFTRQNFAKTECDVSSALCMYICISVCICVYVYMHMGQFLQDGNFGGFMSYFFSKQKATVAKPMDFDDFYRFVLTNHDLFMVRKSILTLSIQKKTHFLVP